MRVDSVIVRGQGNTSKVRGEAPLSHPQRPGGHQSSVGKLRSVNLKGQGETNKVIGRLHTVILRVQGDNSKVRGMLNSGIFRGQGDTSIVRGEAPLTHPYRPG